MEGKAPLRTLSELAAFFAAKEQKDTPPPPVEEKKETPAAEGPPVQSQGTNRRPNSQLGPRRFAARTGGLGRGFGRKCGALALTPPPNLHILIALD